MPCTTILVGKNASYDGSTLVARNEDSSNGVFEPTRMRVVHPDEQPRVYTSVLSHLTVELPDNPMRYTSVPDVVPGHGIWAEAGFNELNVGMSATETLTTNERVRGADPLVDYAPAKGNEGEDGYVPAQPGGLGEEDMVTLVLPYAKSARDGVRILGDLLERYGTYENNGIAFSDVDEIWWLETIGGHHWIAKRVPDDAYVTKPFSPAELTARIDALYRRTGGDVPLDTGEISQPPFLLNTRTRTLEKNGQRVKLTQVEYAIIKLFMENPGKALSREEILDTVWGKDYFGELKIVDVNIRRLRIKIEDNAQKPTYVNTVWGYGYKWRN